jgi:bifunctional enzyme CysN/CysC
MTDLMAHAGHRLAAQQEVSLLRFIMCGSADGGKSTLVGRLLRESRLVLDDLAAEPEQETNIDVVRHGFATGRRRFVVADTPGHEQDTRNVVTGAPTADLAVIVVDARAGVLTQTRRHSHLVALLGIRHIILAVNKLDLVGYAREAFERIDAEYRAFATGAGLPDIVSIPLSARHGDNVTRPGPNTPWYCGPTLLEQLETVQVPDDRAGRPFRMIVQAASRPRSGFHGWSGVIPGGVVRIGDRVRVLPSGAESNVARIVTHDGEAPEAVAGQSVTLTLTDDVEVGHGDVIAAAGDPPAIADQFEAHVVWLSEDALLPGQRYLAKVGAASVGLTVEQIRHQLNVDTSQHTAARTLGMDQIGLCTVHLDRPRPFEAYRDSRDLGGFVVIDRLTNATVGAGLLRCALRRADNIHWQQLEVDRAARASLMRQRPAVVWFTGLSGAGKSTIADAVERRLHALGRHTYLLDGDNLRHGLNRDLGFTPADRVENVRRSAEVAALMADAGLIVLICLISPFRAERRMARDLVADATFVEVFVDAPLEVAEARDRKGLYAKARRGELKNFTGIDSPYEAPEHPEIHIRTAETSAEDAVEKIVAYLLGRSAERG